MDPFKKPDTNLSLEELVKRDKVKSKTTMKKTLKPGIGGKMKLMKKKAGGAPAGKTLGSKPNKTAPQAGGDGLKVHRKLIKKGGSKFQGRPNSNNPERKFESGPKGLKQRPQQRPVGPGKQLQQTPRHKGDKVQQRRPMDRDHVKGGNKPPAQRGQDRPAERGERQRDPKAVRFSDVRLKVRNIDCQKVTNYEITNLFEGFGELIMCKFDYNNFGNFLGSATVQFKKPESAKKAINEYHGAELDGKVITIEYDIENNKSVKDASASDHKSNNVIFLRTKKPLMNEEASGMAPFVGQGNSGIVPLGGSNNNANTLVPSHTSGGGYTSAKYGRGNMSQRDTRN